MAQSKSLLNDLSHALDLLESENARLLDDNAHLQEVVTDDELRMQKVLEENAKLRELVNAQCECVKHDDCSECVHYSEGKCTFPFKVMHRELGIEVVSV